MKAKRFLSLMLSLALAVSLAAPARAVEEENSAPDRYTFIEQYIAQQPIPEDFDDEAWYLEYEAWDYDDMSKAEYMQWMELTEEEFRMSMWQSYAWEMQLPIYEQAEAAYNARLVDEYAAAHPGELEALTTEELLARKGYTETLTPLEQFMEDWGLDTVEAAEKELVSGYVSARSWVEECAALAAEYRAADPESWESFDADAFFTEHWAIEGQSKEDHMRENFVFTDEEFADWMYVQYMDDRDYYDGVDYDPGFTYGPGYEPWDVRPLTLYANGAFVAGEADGTIYAVDGVSYASPELINEVLDAHYPNSYGPVPIKAAAQLRGWDVVWNAHNNQVVLLDPAAFRTGDFSAFDRLVRRAMELSAPTAGQTTKTTGKAQLALTVLDSIDGDKTCKADITATLTQRDGVFDARLRLDAAELLGLLSPQVLEKLAQGDNALSARELKTLLRGLEVELIVNLEEGMAYCRAPFLTLLTGDEAVGEAWTSYDLGGEVDMEALTALYTGGWDTEGLLYSRLLTQSADSYLGADHAYENVLSTLSVLRALAGPDTVKEAGGGFTWKVDAAALDAAMADMGEEEVAGVFKEYEVSLTLDREGRMTSTSAMRLDTDVLGVMISDNGWRESSAWELAVYQWLMGLLDFRMTSHSSGTAQKSAGTLRFQWKNQFELTVDVESAQVPVKEEALRAAPPAEDLVIPAFR